MYDRTRTEHGRTQPSLRVYFKASLPSYSFKKKTWKNKTLSVCRPILSKKTYKNIVHSFIEIKQDAFLVNCHRIQSRGEFWPIQFQLRVKQKSQIVIIVII